MGKVLDHLTFFEVFELCHSLDLQRTNAYAKRKTKVYFCEDLPRFKVTHIEYGTTTTQVFVLKPDDDIEFELRSLHAIVDDKVRNARVILDEDWIYPVPS